MTKKKQAKARGSSRADGVTVREVGRRQFVVDFSIDLGGGKRYRFRRQSPFDTIGQSREWGRQHREALLTNGGKREKVEPRVDPTAPRSFAYWATRYVDTAESPAKRDGPNRPGTIRSKKNILNTHLVPAFGKRLVTEIGDDDLETYLIQKSRDGLARGTLRNHVAKLRGVLNLAKRRGNAAEKGLAVPTVSIDRDRGEKLPATLSESQTDILLATAEERAPAWQHALLALLFRGGMRCGEALGLRWSDINFELETIKIQRSANDDGVSEFTKTGKIRTITLHWEIRDALLRLGGGDGWVFPSPGRGRRPSSKVVALDSAKPRSYQTALQAIKPLWESLGFVGDDGQQIGWHTHLGRHSFGRHWAERGWPERGLMDQLGHTDANTTRIYMHWSRAKSAELIQQLGRRRLRVVK